MIRLAHWKKHAVLFSILVGAFSLVLTNSAFNILLPSFVQLYDISTTLGGWIITLYLLAMTITMPLATLLVDRLGRKRTYLWGIGLYALFSVLGGLFDQYVQMILIVRFMHGVAAGLMIPLSLVLLFDVYGKEVRGKVTGVWGMLLTLAPVFGPTVGGIMIQVGELKHLFWMNVPFALVSLLLCSRLIKLDQPAHRKTIRLQAIILMLLGISGISLGIHMTSSPTFPWWIAWFVLFSGVIILIRFIQKENLQQEPFIRFVLLRNPVYAISVIMTAIQASVLFGVLFVLPLMFQEVFHFSPSLTGALFIPTAICMSLFVWIGGSLIDSAKSLSFIAYGVVFIAISVFVFAAVPMGASLVVIVLFMALRGVGTGLSNMTVTTIGLNSLKDNDLHEGSALSNTIKRLASSLTMMVLTVYYDVRWTIISQSGESIQQAKWLALKEECLVLGGLMLVTLPMALFLNRRNIVKRSNIVNRRKLVKRRKMDVGVEKW